MLCQRRLLAMDGLLARALTLATLLSSTWLFRGSFFGLCRGWNLSGWIRSWSRLLALLTRLPGTRQSTLLELRALFLLDTGRRLGAPSILEQPRTSKMAWFCGLAMDFDCTLGNPGEGPVLFRVLGFALLCAASHGTLRRRNSADEVRRSRRAEFPLQAGRPVEKATQKLCEVLWKDFVAWLERSGLPDSVVDSAAADVDTVNLVLRRYGRELYHAEAILVPQRDHQLSVGENTPPSTSTPTGLGHSLQLAAP